MCQAFFFVGLLFDFRKDTRCRALGLYSGSFWCSLFSVKAFSSCEKPRKVWRTDLAGITFLSIHALDEFIQSKGCLCISVFIYSELNSVFHRLSVGLLFITVENGNGRRRVMQCSRIQTGIMR